MLLRGKVLHTYNEKEPTYLADFLRDRSALRIFSDTFTPLTEASFLMESC